MLAPWSKETPCSFDVMTVAEAGWAGSKNGELLRRAAGNVDVFITVDKNLVHQQNVKGLVPEILIALENVRPVQTQQVGG
jgi:hypothetical protein